MSSIRWQSVTGHISEAKFWYANGNTQLAIDNLQAAKKLPRSTKSERVISHLLSTMQGELT